MPSMNIFKWPMTFRFLWPSWTLHGFDPTSLTRAAMCPPGLAQRRIWTDCRPIWASMITMRCADAMMALQSDPLA